MLGALHVLAAGLDPVEQRHLLEARQMQALSFAVHIPLVCFGIAFPAVVGARGAARQLRPGCVSRAVTGRGSDWDRISAARDRRPSPYGRTRMIVCPLIRSVGLRAATASS